MASTMRVRALLVVIAIMCMGASLGAQQPMPPLPFAKLPFASLREALFANMTLSDKETKAVFALATDVLNQRAALGPAMMAATPEEKLAKAQEMSNAHAVAIRKVLTPRHQVVFDVNYAAWKKERAEHPMAPPGVRPPPVRG